MARSSSLAMRRYFIEPNKGLDAVKTASKKVVHKAG